MKEEIWLTVPDNKDYAVSNHGRVMRITASPGTRPGRLRTPTKGTDGYFRVGLKNDDKLKYRGVHQLVCAAFHGPPPSPKHEVHHKDHDKANNLDSNLEWVTRSVNNSRRRPYTSVRGPDNKNSKRYIVTSPKGEEMHIIGLKDFCRSNGLGEENMRAVMRGRITMHRGWKCRRP